MKKILLLAFVLFMNASAFAQFSANVYLNGTCVYPQPNTVYGVAVTIENINTGATYGPYYTSVSTMNYIPYTPIIVPIPIFAPVDAYKIYRVHYQAAKLDITNPYPPICYNRKTINGPYSTEDFESGHVNATITLL